LTRSERANNILDLEFDADQLMNGAEETLPTRENLVEFVQSSYVPKNTFFDYF
jgi:hypothetical protein